MQKRVRNGALRGVPAMALVAFVAGCGSDDLGSMVDSYLAELEEQSEIYCACFEEFGYSSLQECLNDGPSLGPSAQACVEDALAEDEEASKDSLSCLLGLERNFTKCFEDRLECSSQDSADACFDDYDVGAQDCPELPPSVEEQVEACGF